MIGCYLKTSVLRGTSRRTQIKPVAVPNNAVPNRGLISNRFDILNMAVPCGISSNNAQQSPCRQEFFVAQPFKIMLSQKRLCIICLCAYLPLFGTALFRTATGFICVRLLIPFSTAIFR